MSDSLGTIKGQLILDVKQALNAYTQVRQQNISTVTALQTGAGAMLGAGTVIAGAGALLAGGFLSAVNAAAQFDKTMAFAGAISNYTEAQLKSVKDEAIDLGNKTVYSNQQVADSFVELAKAGVTAHDIVHGVGEAVVYLGAASDLPLDTAANIITSALSTFGLSADHAVDVANKLQGAANASIIDVTDIGTSLKYAGGTAAALGIPLNDVVTTLGELGKAGIKGSTAGTSLRQILVSLTGSSDKAKDSLKDLGIITKDGTNRFFDAQGTLKPLPQVFDILKSSVAGLSKEQQLSSLRSIFQQRSLSSVFTLLNGGSASFEEFAAAMANTTAIDVANKRLDNLAGSVEILKGNFESAQVIVGENFQGVATVVVRAATSMLQALVALPQPVQVILAALTGIVGGLLIFIGVGGIFAGSILNIIALVTRLNAVFPLLTALTGAATRAQAAFNFVIAANPIAKIIAIIGLLVGVFAILYNTNQAFHDQVQALFTQLGPIINQVVPFIQSLVASFLNLATGAGGVLIGFLPTVISLFTSLLGIIVDVGGNILAQVLPPILALVQVLVAGFLPVIQAVLPLLTTFGQILGAVFSGNLAAIPSLLTAMTTQLVGVVTALVSSFLPAIIQVIVSIVGGIASLLPTLIPVVVQAIVALVTAIIGVLPLLVQAGIQLILALLQGLVSVLPIIVGALSTLVGQLVATLVTALPQLITAGITIIMALLQGLVTAIPQLITAVVGLIPVLITAIVGLIPQLINAAIQLFLGLLLGLVAAIPQIITALIGAITSIITAIVDAIPALIDGAIQLFLGLLLGLLQALPLILTALVNAIPQIILALVNAIPKLITGAIQLFLGIITGLLSALPQIITALVNAIPQIINALIKAGPQFAQAGVQLIQGLINGFGSMGGALVEAVKKLANSAINSFKKLFGIASPSKLFTTFGIFTVQGLINGVDGMRRDAVNSIVALANAVNAVPMTLSPLSATVGATADLTSQLANAQAAAATLGVESATTISLENLRDVIDEIQPSITNIDVDVNNPVAEPASASLPGAIREAAFVAGV